MSNTTIQKKKIYKPLFEDSMREDLHKLIYEFLDNSNYNNSKKCFIHVTKDNDDDEYNIYYSYDNPINDSETMNRLLSINDSKTSEIGHCGNGFKRFCYKHYAKTEIFSLINNTRYLYTEQHQDKIYELSKNNDLNDADFSNKMDSTFTNFTTEKKFKDAPSWYTKYISNDELPFKPKTLIKFTSKSKIDNNYAINEYKSLKMYKNLLNNLQLKNNNNLEIYIKNELLDDFNHWKKINYIDHIGLTNKSKIETYLTVAVYSNKQDKTYFKIIDSSSKNINLLNKIFTIEINRNNNGRAHVLNNTDLSDYELHFEIKTITLNKDYLSKIYKELYKDVKCDDYYGIYLLLNNNLINCDKVYFTHLNPSKNDKSGYSSKRMIINCKSNIDKYLKKTDIKSNTTINSKAYNNEIIIYIKYIFHSLYKKFFNKPDINFKNLISTKNIKSVKPKDIDKEENGYVYLIQMGPELYKFGYTKQSIRKYYKSYKTDSILDKIKKKYNDKVFLNKKDITNIYSAYVNDPMLHEKKLRTIIKKYFNFIDREEYFILRNNIDIFNIIRTFITENKESIL